MADDSYPSGVYRNRSGDLVVPSGAEIQVESGGSLEAPEVANANTQGGIPVVHRVTVGNAAGDTDVTLDHKTRVLDVWVVKAGANGGAGDTVTVKNGTTAITDALDLNVSDKAIVRAATIDDAQHEIAAAGTLRVAAAKATNPSCEVYILGVRVA